MGYLHVLPIFSKQIDDTFVYTIISTLMMTHPDSITLYFISCIVNHADRRTQCVEMSSSANLNYYFIQKIVLPIIIFPGFLRRADIIHVCSPCSECVRPKFRENIYLSIFCEYRKVSFVKSLPHTRHATKPGTSLANLGKHFNQHPYSKIKLTKIIRSDTFESHMITYKQKIK